MTHAKNNTPQKRARPLHDSTNNETEETTRKKQTTKKPAPKKPNKAPLVKPFTTAAELNLQSLSKPSPESITTDFEAMSVDERIMHAKKSGHVPSNVVVQKAHVTRDIVNCTSKKAQVAFVAPSSTNASQTAAATSLFRVDSKGRRLFPTQIVHNGTEPIPPILVPQARSVAFASVFSPKKQNQEQAMIPMNNHFFVCIEGTLFDTALLNATPGMIFSSDEEFQAALQQERKTGKARKYPEVYEPTTTAKDKRFYFKVGSTKGDDFLTAAEAAHARDKYLCRSFDTETTRADLAATRQHYVDQPMFSEEDLAKAPKGKHYGGSHPLYVSKLKAELQGGPIQRVENAHFEPPKWPETTGANSIRHPIRRRMFTVHVRVNRKQVTVAVPTMADAAAAADIILATGKIPSQLLQHPTASQKGPRMK